MKKPTKLSLKGKGESKNRVKESVDELEKLKLAVQSNYSESEGQQTNKKLTEHQKSVVAQLLVQRLAMS